MRNAPRRAPSVRYSACLWRRRGNQHAPNFRRSIGGRQGSVDRQTLRSGRARANGARVWRLTVHYRQCLVAACVLAMAITVRTAGAVAFETLPQSTPQTSGSKPTTAQTAAQKPAPAPVAAAGYVGTSKCLECHEDQAATLKGTPHGQAKNPRSPAAGHGCESCHGPGQAHVEDDASGHMPKIKEMKPGDVNQICLTCHNRSDHVGWEGSGTNDGISPAPPRRRMIRTATGWWTPRSA